MLAGEELGHNIFGQGNLTVGYSKSFIVAVLGPCSCSEPMMRDNLFELVTNSRTFYVQVTQMNDRDISSPLHAVQFS